MTSTNNGWMKLTSLRNRAEAELLAGRLREEGMPSRIVKATDDPAGWMTAYGSSSGRFDIHVPAASKSDAQHLLDDSSSLESPGIEHSHHRPIRLIGRGLLGLALVSVLAVALIDALR